MSLSFLSALNPLNGVRLRHGVRAELFKDLERSLAIRLPDDHQSALSESNGVQVYGGYFTLFGIGPEANVDSVNWNDPSCWKFAWESRCSDYWCFAETAWGDQYAYNIPALIAGESQVYFLDCLSMTPNLVASSFSEFLTSEFIRSAIAPYDEMIKEARQVHGDLELGEHLIYTPSILLGGKEEISTVRKLDARTAMICNGDIASQLDAGPHDRNVKTVTPYEDAEGRMRLELNWA